MALLNSNSKKKKLKILLFSLCLSGIITATFFLYEVAGLKK